MGCDIHIFVEYEIDNGVYLAISDGEFSMPRSYDLFAALAGVRGDLDSAPKFAPRGIPDDISRETAGRYFVPVMDSATAAEWQVGEHCSREEACRLVEEGHSHFIGDKTSPPLLPTTDSYISYPDFHDPSWLTLDEIHDALAHASPPHANIPAEFQLLLGYMENIQECMRMQVRIVFWFDN
ncbi:MAG: hypothetical protein QGH94_00075 [Phycisphaerae bacterium]|jgi:hypothetical protein|nr:hypothetical protein [Phycisphaerae bacterium]MDP7286364.1 hypothetical protein [Phycisphaerae bacterium]